MIPYFKLIHNPYVLLSFISVCFFFIFSGNSAFEWPTQAEIPIIEKIINPLYLMNDFYTNSAINSPKIFFSYFIYFFTYLGIEYNQILYFLKSLIYIMSPVLIFDLYLKILFIFNNKTYEKSKNIILTLTFLMALPFFGFIQGYGYTTIFGWEAIQSTFALTPMKLSFFFGLIYLLIKFSEKNGYLSSAVLFASFLIHPVIGITNFIIALSILLFSREIIKKRFQLFLDFIFGIFIPLILIIILFNDTSTMSHEDFFNLYVVSRHPHHYFVSNILDFYSLCWFLFSLLPLIFSIYFREIKLILFSVLIISLICFSVLFQYIFSEVYPITTIMQFGPIRITSYASMLLSINILLVTNHAIKEKKVIINRFNFLENLFKNNFLYPVNLLIVITMVSISASIFLYKDPIAKYSNEKNLDDLITWIINNTEEGSSFATNGIDTVFFRVASNRAIVADGMIPFRTKDLIEFSSRFDIYNNIDNLSIKDLACLSKINKIDYFVSNVKKEEISIYRDKHWFLYKINLTDCQEL